MVDYNEIEFLKSNDLLDQFSEIEEGIEKKKFVIKDVGVTHRWISHWDKEGLLLSKHQQEKWRRFDLVEYVWLKMIMVLRSYNIPLKTIKQLKESLVVKFVDMPQEQKDVFIENAIAIARNQDPNHSDDVFRKNIDEFLTETFEINWLKLYIVDAMVLKNHLAIALNQSGEVLPIKEKYLNQWKTEYPVVREFLQKHYVSISISEILSDFINTKDLNVVCDEMAVITPEEKEVLRVLREEDADQVKIVLDEGKQIDLIEITKKQNIDKAARLTDMIMNDGYQSIEVKTQKGNIVHCTNTRKIKLNKK